RGLRFRTGSTPAALVMLPVRSPGPEPEALGLQDARHRELDEVHGFFRIPAAVLSPPLILEVRERRRAFATRIFFGDVAQPAATHPLDLQLSKAGYRCRHRLPGADVRIEAPSRGLRLHAVEDRAVIAVAERQRRDALLAYLVGERRHLA